MPFYLRTGKRLPKRVTEVAIQFKRVPHLPFSDAAAEQLEPNVLVLRIQPDEGISLRFGAKVPATRTQIRTVNMDFRYGTAFVVADRRGVRDAAARRDARRPDALHPPGRGRARRWRVVEPVLEAWQRQGGAPHLYAGRDLGAGRGRRAAGPRRAALAAAVSVTLSTIESTLADLREHETSGSGRGVRTHMLDLVVFCDRREQADEMVEVVAIAAVQPALAGDHRAGRGATRATSSADARVFCTPVGGDSDGVQVCSELVSLARGRRRRSRCRAWSPGCSCPTCRCSCTGGPSRTHRGSCCRPAVGARDPRRGRLDGRGRDARVAARALVQRQPARSVTDLSWTKITGWREAVARAFDNAENAAALARR